MKLWLCTACMRDAEPCGLVVAPTQEEAVKKWESQLDEWASFYASASASEVGNVDGYKVVFAKGKKIALVR